MVGFCFPVFFGVYRIKRLTSPSRVLPHFADPRLPHQSVNYAPPEMDLHVKRCKILSPYWKNATCPISKGGIDRFNKITHQKKNSAISSMMMNEIFYWWRFFTTKTHHVHPIFDEGTPPKPSPNLPKSGLTTSSTQPLKKKTGILSIESWLSNNRDP